MSAILKQKLIDIANGFTKYGLWKGGGSSALSEMTDVSFTNLQTNDVLTYNGSKWVNDDNLQTQINTLNSNFDEFFIAKSYLVNKTINAYCVENVLIDNIAGYTPIGCFYDCNTEETVTCATAPKRRKSDNTLTVGIINGYPSQMSTQGIIYVYYIKNIDIQ